jgi:hypothetical protein
MGLTDLPLEVKSMIVERTLQRQDLETWDCICRDTKDVLRQYRDNLVKKCKLRNKVDHTHSEVCISSPETFLAWMRAKPRKDDAIMEQSHLLFYDFYQEHEEESRDEEKTRKENARLVLRHVRDHVGDDHFVKVFETSVKDDMVWPMDVVFALSKDNEMEGDEDDDADDGTNRDHEFALRLERAALGTLKSSGRPLHGDDGGRPSVEYSIDQWAVEHKANLEKSDYLAAAGFAKSMLDYALAQAVCSDEYVQEWADNCLSSYFRFLLWSNVKSGDEGELADSMLDIVKRRPDYRYVQDWADRCFNYYERFGMPVHAVRFAEGMLEIARAYGSDTADLSSKWKQRCLSQESKQALWKKAGDLAQVMLRAYFECGSLCKSLPQPLQISEEKQFESVAHGSQQPEFRLLKRVGPENFELAFPEKLPRGLLNNAQAQAQILEAVTRATRNANGTPIHGKNMIGELRSAIESWKTYNSGDTIGVYQDRKSTNPTYNV